VTASVLDPFIQITSSSVGTAVVSAIVAAIVYWFLEGRKFKREQQINYLKERLDTFYSPLVFHFNNMRSWGGFLGTKYAWDQATLVGKNQDMANIMRTGMRFVSPEIEKLWYEWQPFSVAATVQEVYKEQFNMEEFIKHTERLHEKLKAEREELMKHYRKEIGLHD
jgi:uncharacterized membrane-anchored protein YhcB (DUF1043 family)